MRKLRETTTTHLVFELLKQKDDAYTAREIAIAISRPTHNVFSALNELSNYKAVEKIEGCKHLYWFATPTTDTRMKVCEERTPESSPRKRRTRKAAVVGSPLPEMHIDKVNLLEFLK